MLWQTCCTTCHAGSRPAVGYTPAGMQQIVGANMSIPFMPGMSMGAMHIGPNGPRPTMAGPAPAPANGPAPATAGSGGGAPGTTGMGTAGGVGPMSGAGAGLTANRAGHPGLNFGALLQTALAGAGGQPNRQGQSVLLEHDLNRWCFSAASGMQAYCSCLVSSFLATLSCLEQLPHVLLAVRRNHTCQDPVSSSTTNTQNLGCLQHSDFASHFIQDDAGFTLPSYYGHCTMRCFVQS